MPMGDAGPEPLLSLYNVNCLPAVHRLLAEGSHKVVDLCGQVEVLAVPVEQLRAADPRLLSLLNVNTAADLDAARAIAREVAAK
jgi:molybdopterin-guanine dinucleotide biosynthesis protein A